jgi:hypothetical protein
MKKLLLTFVLVLTTLISFAQDKPYYMRAETFESGYKNSNGDIVWNESTIQSCSIIIKLEEKEAVIHSSITQVYNVLLYNGNKDGISKWYCSDYRGRSCNLYLLESKKNPGKMSLIIEFSDYVWAYICDPIN